MHHQKISSERKRSNVFSSEAANAPVHVAEHPCPVTLFMMWPAPADREDNLRFVWLGVKSPSILFIRRRGSDLCLNNNSDSPPVLFHTTVRATLCQCRHVNEDGWSRGEMALIGMVLCARGNPAPILGDSHQDGLHAWKVMLCPR